MHSSKKVDIALKERYLRNRKLLFLAAVVFSQTFSESDIHLNRVNVAIHCAGEDDMNSSQHTARLRKQRLLPRDAH